LVTGHLSLVIGHAQHIRLSAIPPPNFPEDLLSGDQLHFAALNLINTQLRFNNPCARNRSILPYAVIIRPGNLTMFSLR